MSFISFIDSMNHLWKNRVADEPLDSVRTTRWNSCLEPVDKCLNCGEFDDCFECRFEWGDTGKYEYVRELCLVCWLSTMKECRNVSADDYQKYLDKYT
jgi:hypothetical protein